MLYYAESEENEQDVLADRNKEWEKGIEISLANMNLVWRDEGEVWQFVSKVRQ